MKALPPGKACQLFWFICSEFFTYCLLGQMTSIWRQSVASKSSFFKEPNYVVHLSRNIFLIKKVCCIMSLKGWTYWISKLFFFTNLIHLENGGKASTDIRAQRQRMKADKPASPVPGPLFGKQVLLIWRSVVLFFFYWLQNKSVTQHRPLLSDMFFS